jgi:hypothetical protein
MSALCRKATWLASALPRQRNDAAQLQTGAPKVRPKAFLRLHSRGFATEIDRYASIRLERYWRAGGLQIQCLD